MNDNALILYSHLEERFGVPYTIQHLGRLERSGRFPRRIRLSRNRVAWLAREVEAWIAERAAARPDC